MTSTMKLSLLLKLVPEATKQRWRREAWEYVRKRQELKHARNSKDVK